MNSLICLLIAGSFGFVYQGKYVEHCHTSTSKDLLLSAGSIGHNFSWQHLTVHHMYPPLTIVQWGGYPIAQ